jgi:DNA-binding NarL/FixJ family response regulator
MGYLGARPAELREGDLALLAELASGAQLDVVARRLGVSERTVRRRIRKICDQLGVGTAMEAVVWAVRRGLV